MGDNNSSYLFKIFVEFVCEQSAEDVYREKGTRNFYIRQPCNDGNVCWLSATKWRGGYEADCPLPEWTEITVLDSSCNVLFVETMINPHSNGDAYAIPTGEFSYDGIKRISEEISAKYELLPHPVWCKWMESFMPEKYERDNWLYCDTIDRRTEVVSTEFVLGVVYRIVKHYAVHKLCGKPFIKYTIENSIGLCVGFCGCVIPELKTKENKNER